MGNKCDCNKCIYGLYHEIKGCQIEENPSIRVAKANSVLAGKNPCKSFRIGNKYYRKYLKKREPGEEISEWIEKQPIEERYKYLPSEYVEYPHMCIGSDLHDISCEFREDGHIKHGCEYCWKNEACKYQLQRETTIFEENKKKTDKLTSVKKILIDVMIKLVIIIGILLYNLIK